jgi:carboxylesterase type B
LHQLTGKQFGGDPKHVTIDGDSAGAASVDLHLTAYGGRDDGLFHAAIGESNSYGAQLTVEESQYQYDGLVERTGCSKAKDTLDCLRKLDVEVIAKNNINMVTPGGKGTPVFMYSNVIEGPGGFTEEYTYTAFTAGKFVKVPVIFGYVLVISLVAMLTISQKRFKRGHHLHSIQHRYGG